MTGNPELANGQEQTWEYLTETTDSIEHLFFMAQEVGIRACRSGGTELHTNAPMPKLFGFAGVQLEVRPKEPVPHLKIHIERGGAFEGAYESDEVIVAKCFDFVVHHTGEFGVEVWTEPRTTGETLGERSYEKCFVRLGAANFRLVKA